MPLVKPLPKLLAPLRAEMKHLLQFVAVRKPHTMEISGGVPLRTEKVLDRPADQLKAVVKGLVSGLTRLFRRRRD